MLPANSRLPRELNCLFGCHIISMGPDDVFNHYGVNRHDAGANNVEEFCGKHSKELEREQKDRKKHDGHHDEEEELVLVLYNSLTHVDSPFQTVEV
jgi:hypothetical protein